MPSLRPARRFLSVFEANAVLADLRKALVSGRYYAERADDDDVVVNLSPFAGEDGDVIQIRRIEQTYPSKPKVNRR